MQKNERREFNKFSQYFQSEQRVSEWLREIALLLSLHDYNLKAVPSLRMLLKVCFVTMFV